MAVKKFEINNIEYRYNEESGRFSKVVNGKAVRIGKGEYEEAWVDYCKAETAESNATEEIKEVQKKAKKPSRSKSKVGYEKYGIALTEKQVDFIKHLPDTNFWEDGLESIIWVDVLCDEIGGQFAGKPMTVGAMVSTLREKGVVDVAADRVNGKKCKSMALTEVGAKIAKDLGLS